MSTRPLQSRTVRQQSTSPGANILLEKRLANRVVQEMVASESERHRAERALRTTMARFGEYRCDRERLEFAKQYSDILNSAIPQLNESLRQLTNATGAEGLIWRNLPASRSADDLDVSRIVSLIIAFNIDSMLAPFQFSQEKGGELVSVLWANEALAHSESGAGLVKFCHHVDFAHSGNEFEYLDESGRPWYNILAGVRNNGTLTTYAPISSTVKALRSRDIAILMQRRFITPVPKEMGVGDVDSGPMSVLWRTRSGRLGISIRSSTKPLCPRDAQGQFALDRLMNALLANEVPFRIDNGVYAITSNLFGTHSREAIQHFGERLVLRTYSGPLETLRAQAHVFDVNSLLPSAFI